MGWLQFVWFSFLIFTLAASQSQEPCSLFCGRHSGSFPQDPARGVQGPPGKQGPPGVPGQAIQCDCNSSNGEVCQRIKVVDQRVDNLEGSIRQIEEVPTSCLQIKTNSSGAKSGVYTLQDSYGNPFRAYCDMATNGGGWTLVASIHDNNLGPNGRCTVGDRWSSEQGNKADRASGDGNWNNRNIFGHIVSVTSDDYKNTAYFELQSSNIMIWQVPNDTPLHNISADAYLKYRTTNGFLRQYGGNLFYLYLDHFPIKSKAYSFPSDSGPGIPVTFDIGNGVSLASHLAPNVKADVEAGYIQFRVVSAHRDAFALCPGFRLKTTMKYPGHTCLGSTGWNNHVHYCGDTTFYYEGTPAFGTGWTADEVLIKTTFLLFYR